MKPVKAKFVTRPTGIWVELLGSGRLFEYSEHGTKKQTERVARAYASELQKRVDPVLSRKKVASAIEHFEALVQSVKDCFPLAGRKEDFFYYIDESEQTIVVRFGSVNVYVNDQGLFGAELIVNWLTKEPVVICSNLTLSAMSEFLKGSPGSRSFTDLHPTELYLNQSNTDFASTWVKLSK